MTIKEICFLLQTPLTKRDYDRFGIEILRSRGFKITILDATKILQPGYLAGYQPHDCARHENIICFENKDELVDYLKKNKDVLFFDNAGLSKNSLFVYQTFKENNIRFARVCASLIPMPGLNEKSFIYYVKRLLRFYKTYNNAKKMILNIQKFLIDRLRRFFVSTELVFPKLNGPHYIIAGGRECASLFDEPPAADENTQIIWAHALDYDLYLENRCSLTEADNYCVFLDEYLPYHPDCLTLEDGGPSVNAEKYYSSLNKYFDQLEYKYGLPVIIAAHPRSQYDRLPDCFKGRRVIRGHSIELVTRSKFVMIHCSTSISFAVMYRKPLVFITMNEIEKTVYRDLVKSFARQFGKKPINIDKKDSLNLDGELSVNEKAYSRYSCNYIKIPGTPEKPFWEIVADKILAFEEGSIASKSLQVG